jgi:hypothetical protein
MGIFRDVRREIKKAAPLIGAGIGMYFGGAWGAALGSGLGSAASGRSTEESLRNAALAGGTAYMAGGSGFGQKGNFSTANSPMRGMFSGNSATNNSSSGVNSLFDKMMPDSNIGKYALGSTALGLLLPKPKQPEFKDRPYTGGEYRGGTLMTEDDDGNMAYYDGGDEEERTEYYNQLRRNEDRKKRKLLAEQNEVFTAADGGEVNGPGTSTSDSVPARLSDGEFVVTADAVRGAGGGDRNVGAARMYDMMSQLERAA